MVGVPGLEPGTSSLSVTRSNQLSYTPIIETIYCHALRRTPTRYEWFALSLSYTRKYNRILAKKQFYFKDKKTLTGLGSVWLM